MDKPGSGLHCGAWPVLRGTCRYTLAPKARPTKGEAKPWFGESEKESPVGAAQSREETSLVQRPHTGEVRVFPALPI